MARLIAFRLVYLSIVLIVVSVLLFALSRATGDPRNLYLDEYATREQYDAWGRLWGLDKPLWQQYAVWASKAVRGDFGDSLHYKQHALDVVLDRLPATLHLAAMGFGVTLLVGVPLGVLSAIKRGSVFDYLGRGIALFGQALPSFWIGIMLILLFSVQFGWLPTGQRGGWQHWILPAITLGTGPAAQLLRLVRSSMLAVLGSEYIKFARAKGVSRRSIIWKHAFKNASIAPLTFAGLLIVAFLNGSIVTETVFSWPGVGRLAVLSIFNNDFSVIAAIVLLTAILYVTVNTAVDFMYAYLDPRVRLR